MTPEGERIRKALGTGDTMELQWALEYASAKQQAAADEQLRTYWDEVLRRINAALQPTA